MEWDQLEEHIASFMAVVGAGGSAGTG